MNGDLTLDDLMTIVAHLDDTMEAQRQEISDLREQLHAERQRNDRLGHHVGCLLAYHALQSGLLPERMAHVAASRSRFFTSQCSQPKSDKRGTPIGA